MKFKILIALAFTSSLAQASVNLKPLAGLYVTAEDSKGLYKDSHIYFKHETGKLIGKLVYKVDQWNGKFNNEIELNDRFTVEESSPVTAEGSLLMYSTEKGEFQTFTDLQNGQIKLHRHYNPEWSFLPHSYSHRGIGKRNHITIFRKISDTLDWNMIPENKIR